MDEGAAGIEIKPFIVDDNLLILPKGLEILALLCRRTASFDNCIISCGMV
jgi:hypothetical protein